VGPSEPVPISYVLPIATVRPEPDPELTGYLRRLAREVEDLVVVDGSPDAVFARHHVAWAALGRHVRPARCTPNGKVGGVLTGLRLAVCDRVVLADDDVRWTADGLRVLAHDLRTADVVVPQNHYAPRGWSAVYDSARCLVHRALGGDMPGTLGVRRSALPDGYRGDVLFENLELLRTVAARGGRVRWRLDLLVARRPPTVRHLAGQRIRQAYDELARPAYLAVELAVLPVATVALTRRSPEVLLVLAGTVAVLAELGRRRTGGRAAFSPVAPLLAPLWLLERAVCAWLALAYRLGGGVPYRGKRLRVAATSRRALAGTR
jgi:hypothetical protein